MDLKDFVADALVQIQMGVQEAITRMSVPNARGAINPVWGADANSINSKHIQNVEFDVAVTVSDKTELAGEGRLKIVSFEMGAEKSKFVEQTTVSRIKFVVPVVPPVQIVRDQRE